MYIEETIRRSFVWGFEFTKVHKALWDISTPAWNENIMTEPRKPHRRLACSLGDTWEIRGKKVRDVPNLLNTFLNDFYAPSLIYCGNYEKIAVFKTGLSFRSTKDLAAHKIMKRFIGLFWYHEHSLSVRIVKLHRTRLLISSRLTLNHRNRNVDMRALQLVKLFRYLSPRVIFSGRKSVHPRSLISKDNFIKL